MVIMAQESGLRMNTSSARQSRGLRDGLSTRVTIPKIQLEQISIAETPDREKS